MHTILTQDVRLINVHEKLNEKFPDIEDIQHTDEEYLQHLQATIDECKEDLDDLYDKFDALLNPTYYTYSSVETVRAANIGPLDPVA